MIFRPVPASSSCSTCMQESKVSAQESMYKCSCAIDAIAAKVSYSQVGRPVDGCQRHHDRGRARRRHARHEGRAQAGGFVPRAAGQRQEGLLHPERLDGREPRRGFSPAAPAFSDAAHAGHLIVGPIAWSQAVAGAPPEMADFAVENPAPGVYVHYGQQAEMTPRQLRRCGQSRICRRRPVRRGHRHGRNIRGRPGAAQAIRRVTTVPVCYVINTHVHPDHIFGNAAFADDHPRIHRPRPACRRDAPGAARTISTHCTGTWATLRSGSAIVMPTRTIATTEDLDLGGRTLRLRSWPTAHTDTDLTVYDRASADAMAR